MRETLIAAFLTTLLFGVSSSEWIFVSEDMEVLDPPQWIPPAVGSTANPDAEEVTWAPHDETRDLEGTTYSPYVESSTQNALTEEFESTTASETADLEPAESTTPALSSTTILEAEEFRRMAGLPTSLDMNNPFAIFGFIMKKFHFAEDYAYEISVDKAKAKRLPTYSFFIVSLVYFLSRKEPFMIKFALADVSEGNLIPSNFQVDTFFEQFKFPQEDVEEAFQTLSNEKDLKFPALVKEHLVYLAEKYNIALNTKDDNVIIWLIENGAIRPDLIKSSKTLAVRVLTISSEKGFLDQMSADDFLAIMPNDESLLHVLAKVGNIEIYDKMIQSGLNISAVDIFNKSFLEYAVEEGQVDLVKYLSAKGTTLYGRLLLHIAALNGREEMVKYLLKEGLSTKSRNSRGQTALYCAASQRHGKVIDILMDNGASLDATDDYGETLLHIAAKLGDVNATETLISYGAEVDADNFGMTPLYRAAQFGRSDIIKILIERGADVNHGREIGNKLIHIAARNNHSQVVKTLVQDLGVHIDSQGSWDFTALHWASRVGHTKVIQLLLDLGADIEARIDIGRTPLHEAAFWGQIESCRTLLANGAQLNTTDNSERTPSELAKFSDHSALYLMLKDAENKKRYTL